MECVGFCVFACVEDKYALLCSVRQSRVSSIIMVCVENIDAFLHHLEVGEEDHVHDA